MATKNFRSTVLEPTSEFAHGDKLRFTALATVSEVLKGSFSETTIGEDGVYSVDLQYGKHRIDYKPYEGVWRHFADVEVNADTLATTLQDLALASVPVTDETILVLQGILADAESAKTESATLRDDAAASAASASASAADAAVAVSERSFVHRYSFSATESATGTGNYNLVKIDEFGSDRYVVYEHVLYSMSLNGSLVMDVALMIPTMLSHTGYTGNEVLFNQSGSSDIRVFFGKGNGESDPYCLYIATRNQAQDNASLSLNVSTYKKLTPQLIGSTNIDNWLADNPNIKETTKIQLGV